MDGFSFECRSTLSLFVVFLIAIILFLICLTCAAVVLYKFCISNSKDANVPEIRRMQYVCIVAEFLCVVTVGPGICGLLFTRFQCEGRNEILESNLGRASALLTAIPYAITTSCFYGIFAYRVYFVFKTTICELSKKTVYGMVTLLMLLVCVNICLIGSSLIKIEIALIFQGFQMILSVFGAIFLLTLFIIKMQHVSVSTMHSMRTLESTKSTTPNLNSLDQGRIGSTSPASPSIDANSPESGGNASCSASGSDVETNYTLDEMVSKMEKGAVKSTSQTINNNNDNNNKNNNKNEPKTVQTVQKMTNNETQTQKQSTKNKVARSRQTGLKSVKLAIKDSRNRNSSNSGNNSARAVLGLHLNVASDKNDDESENSKNQLRRNRSSSCFSETQSDLIKVMAKLSCLVSITLFFTILSIILTVYNVGSEAHFASILSIVGTSVDMTVNAVCLMLKWSFATNFYRKWCKVCNDVMISKYAKKIDRKADQSISRKNNDSIQLDL